MARETLGDFEQQILLVILRLDGDSYSVPIVLELEERTGREISQAAVYVALRRLEDRGLLTSRMDDHAIKDTGRVRRYFQLTPLALERLRKSRRTLIGLWEGIETMLDEVR